MGPITYSFEELVELKKSGTVPQGALDVLRAAADRILTEPMLSVTKKKLLPPSGNPHDYMSVGIYWWPNLDTPDGLPYVNRDGQINPETQDDSRFGCLVSRIHTLALAAFYFDNPAYGEYAQRQLYDWFLNPETYMTPNARYAQCIPGIVDGRGAGLIDFVNVYELFDGIGILAQMGLLQEETVTGVRDWYSQFIDWVLTHENGMSACNAQNNHGVWYDAHVLAAAVFTDRPQLAKRICTTAYDLRVKKQVGPDGSQPAELARTKGMNYSFYSLRAYSVISVLAEQLGYTQYWKVDPDRGVCILKSAVDYLYPYVLNPESFPYQELYPETTRAKMANMLLRVDRPGV